MKLLLISSVREGDGLYEITVEVSEKTVRRYTYVIGSEYAVRTFENFYRRGFHGKALSVLNKFKEKPIGIGNPVR